MIAATIPPTAEELAPLLASATAKQDEETFIANYLAGLVQVLGQDPRQYRSFGPYWWPLKSMMIERGIQPGAGSLELGTLQRYTLDTPALTLCAAWVYQQGRIEEGKIRTASHQLELAEGELYEYELVDEDMEAFIERTRR